MKVIEIGHIYELNNLGEGSQIIRFVKSLPEGASTNHEGTLSQELLRVLIDRWLELYAQQPCKETHRSIKRARRILIDNEVRAFRRTLRKSYAKRGLHIEQLPVKKNGHLFDLT